MDKKQDRERGIQPENHCHLKRRKKGGESYESAEQYVHAESQDFDQGGRIQRRSGEVGEREKIG